METLAFILTAVTLIGLALAVVFARRPVRSALALIAALLVVASAFAQNEAPYLATLQVLVYAGAIMVLFLFVIMLLNLGPEPRLGLPAAWGLRLSGAVVAMGTLIPGVLVASSPVVTQRVLDGSVGHIGALMFTRFPFAFESISLILLAAVVSAITLAMERPV